VYDGFIIGFDMGASDRRNAHSRVSDFLRTAGFGVADVVAGDTRPTREQTRSSRPAQIVDLLIREVVASSMPSLRASLRDPDETHAEHSLRLRRRFAAMQQSFRPRARTREPRPRNVD
jgi:hypothetical protein